MIGGYDTRISGLLIGHQELGVLRDLVVMYWPDAVLSADDGRQALRGSATNDFIGESVIFRDQAIADAFDGDGYTNALAGSSMYIVVEPDAVCFAVSDDDSEAYQIANHVKIALWQNHSQYEIPRDEWSDAA